MSQFVFDAQVDAERVLSVIRKWTKVSLLSDLRPGEQILDDRIPEILAALDRPTFITIDQGFWGPRWRHPRYAILFFELQDRDQKLIPGLLRALLRRSEFRARNDRMGKIVRVTPTKIEYWEWQSRVLHRLTWQGIKRKNR